MFGERYAVSGRLLAVVVALAMTAAVVLPAHAQDLLVQARAAAERGALDTAYALIQRAAEAEPNRAEVHYALGQIGSQRAAQLNNLSALGVARQAKRGFARAVELEPDNPNYLEGLAGYLSGAPSFAGGDKDSARVLAERLLRIDATRGTFVLAGLLWQGSVADKARADSLVEAFARGAGADRAAQVRVAGFWAQTDRADRALAVGERMLARDSTDAVACYLVARNLVALRRDPRRAQRYLRYALAHQPPPNGPTFLAMSAWWRLGQAYVQVGRPDSARAAFLQALRILPTFQQARLSLDSLEHP
jgi:tetratricopeptide (TPR) repeat protein